MSALAIPLLLAVGLLAGGLAGFLGIGGGVLLVPFLAFSGLSQHAAEATSLLVIFPTAVVGSFVLQRRGVGDLPMALACGAVGVGGSVLGTLTAIALPASALRVVFSVFLAVVGLRLLREGLRLPAGKKA